MSRSRYGDYRTLFPLTKRMLRWITLVLLQPWRLSIPASRPSAHPAGAPVGLRWVMIRTLYGYAAVSGGTELGW